MSIHEPVNDVRTYAGIPLDNLAGSFPKIVKVLRDQARTAFEQGLIAQGYEPKGPSDWSRWGGRNVDAYALAGSTCPECGHHGLDYRPFTKPGSYRVVARCSDCGVWEEF